MSNAASETKTIEGTRSVTKWKSTANGKRNAKRYETGKHCEAYAKEKLAGKDGKRM